MSLVKLLLFILYLKLNIKDFTVIIVLLVEKLRAFFCAVKFNAKSSAKVEGDRNNERKYKRKGVYREYKYDKIYEINNEKYLYDIKGINEEIQIMKSMFM